MVAIYGLAGGLLRSMMSFHACAGSVLLMEGWLVCLCKPSSRHCCIADPPRMPNIALHVASAAPPLPPLPPLGCQSAVWWPTARPTTPGSAAWHSIRGESGLATCC